MANPTLAQAKKECEFLAWNSKKWSWILDELKHLMTSHDSTTIGPWLVVASEFHGGHAIKQHDSVLDALETSREYHYQNCKCGCSHVVLVSEFEESNQ